MLLPHPKAPGGVACRQSSAVAAGELEGGQHPSWGVGVGLQWALRLAPSRAHEVPVGPTGTSLLLGASSVSRRSGLGGEGPRSGPGLCAAARHTGAFVLLAPGPRPGPAHPAGPEGAVDVFVDGSRGRRLRRSAAWQGWQEASPLLEGDPVPETAGSSLDAGAPWGGACRLRCFFSSGGTGPHRRARGQRSRGAWGGDSPGHWGHPPPAPSLCSGLGPVEGRGRKVTALAFMAASCVLTTPRPLQRRTGPELWRAFQGMRNTLKGLNRKSPR